MAIRKASSYSKMGARPYTRHSRRKNQAYIKTVPNNKIVKYNVGNHKDYFDDKHTYTVTLISTQNTQVRDTALEAGRMLLTKVLDNEAPGQYFLMVKVHPHHLLRENKSAAAVAGADRISTGMTQSFGVVIGRAARVSNGQEIFFVSCANEKAARAAKNALVAAKPKLPCATKILFKKLK